jgi:uncharacterized membrane protein
MAQATKKYDYNSLNTLAVVSLASAVTLFGAPAALITGFLALAQLKQSEQKGRWMAITGIALAFAAIALALLLTVLKAFLAVKYGEHYFDGGGFYREDHDGWNMNPMPGTN